jgi:hypothetical protein
MSTLSYDVVLRGRDQIATEIRALEAGARPTQGHTLDTLHQMMAEFERALKAQRKHLN